MTDTKTTGFPVGNLIDQLCSKNPALYDYQARELIESNHVTVNGATTDQVLLIFPGYVISVDKNHWTPSSVWTA